MQRYQLRYLRGNGLWQIWDYGCKWVSFRSYSEKEARDEFERMGGNWHQHPVLY